MGGQISLNSARRSHGNFNFPNDPAPEIVKSIETVAKQYNNLGYNKASLAFIEAGGNDIKDSRCKALDAVIAISTDDKLLI